MKAIGPSKWRRVWVFPPLAVGILIFFFMQEGKKPPEKAVYNENARAVRIIRVQATDFTPIAEGYGNVRPAKVWAAVSQVSGRVTHMHPKLHNGGMIAAGSVLIHIESDDYDLALTQAKSQLAELEMQSKNISASLQIEQRNLLLAEKSFKRQQKLVEQRSISTSQAESAEQALLGARTRVQNLENTLALLPIQRQIQASKITRAERNLANTRLVAPFNMRVSGLQVEQHQFVSAGQTLFSGDSIDRVEITAQVAIGSLKKLFPGQSSSRTEVIPMSQYFDRIREFHPTVKLDIGDGQVVEWEASFVRVSDRIESQTQTIGIVVAVDKPMEKIIAGLRPPLTKGLLVQVSIAGHPQRNSIVIPRFAVHQDQVYRVDAESRLRITPVQRRYDQQQFTLISTGLKPGDQLVVSDLVPAIEGMLLKTEVDKTLEQSLDTGE